MNWSTQTLALVRAAMDEDLGQAGDITSALLDDPHANAFAHVVPRSDGVVCGLALAPLVCEEFSKRLDCMLTFTPWRRESGAVAALGAGRIHDGESVAAGRVIAELQGPRAGVLALERTLLNFLSRLCGIATLTQRFVAAARVTNPGAAILDTRKTLPGWRELDKYAVRCGGGANHRFGLFDAVLIKDNHLVGISTAEIATRVGRMIERLKQLLTSETSRGMQIEVEVDSLEQLGEILSAPGVHVVLVDNFSTKDMRAAVLMRDERGLRGKVALEASGGVTLANVAEVAATGIDRISIGALTHSAPALDIGLDFVS